MAYGKFDPSGPSFSWLLPVSVCVSLLGAGSTVFSFEQTLRQKSGDKTALSAESRHGLAALALHTAQVAALVFWIALLGCVEKGWAGIAVVLSVGVLFSLMLEAGFREGSVGAAGAFGAVHLSLVGVAAVFFGEGAEGGAGAGELLGGMLVGCGGCLLAGLGKRPFGLLLFVCEIKGRAWLGCAALCAPLVLGAALCAFVLAEPMENNYANKSMPLGGPGSGSGPDDPQYFDCRERTSGLYPAYLATAACVVLTPLYLALDPTLGVTCMRGKSLEERNKEARSSVSGASGGGEDRGAGMGRRPEGRQARARGGAPAPGAWCACRASGCAPGAARAHRKRQRRERQRQGRDRR